MNCAGAMSDDADKFQRFLDNYTAAEVDDLLTDAMAEMTTAGGFTGTGLSVIQSGQYGFSHAIQLNLALNKAQEEGATDLKCLAFLTVAYYYSRELDARGTEDVASWYLDSRWDFLAPLLYAREYLFKL